MQDPVPVELVVANSSRIELGFMPCPKDPRTGTSRAWPKIPKFLRERLSGVHAVIANLLCHARDDAMDLVDPLRQ